jgi:multiple sugar transport system permease protein
LPVDGHLDNVAAFPGLQALSSTSGLHRRRHLTGLVFVAPALVLFLLFAAWPILRAFIIGFQNYRVVLGPEWVGLANFDRIFSDPYFGRAWFNTAYFALLALLLGFPIPILLAVMINEIRRGQSYLRLAFYLPAVLPLVVVALLWQRMYAPDDGVFNAALSALGLPTSGWINSPRMAMPSLVFMATWKGAGATMLIYLAALQSLPGEFYEAAEIDGASIWQRFRHITVPHLVPHMQIILILQLLGTLQVFLEPFLMTSGGPGEEMPTLTVLLLIYRYAFNDWNLGWAAAAGLVLFLALVGVAVFQRWLSNRLGSRVVA